jgi:hypothetical protein
MMLVRFQPHQPCATFSSIRGKRGPIDHVALGDRELVVFTHDRLGKEIFGSLQRPYRPLVARALEKVSTRVTDDLVNLGDLDDDLAFQDVLDSSNFAKDAPFPAADPLAECVKDHSPWDQYLNVADNRVVNGLIPRDRQIATTGAHASGQKVAKFQLTTSLSRRNAPGAACTLV